MERCLLMKIRSWNPSCGHFCTVAQILRFTAGMAWDCYTVQPDLTVKRWGYYFKLEQVSISKRILEIPLHWAAYTGCVDAIDVFFQKGVYGGTRDDYGRTPLHLAAVAGWDKAVEKLMVDERVERNSIDRDGRTPLHLAAIKGTKKVVELLLRGIEDRGEDRNGYNAVANTTDNNQFTPLYLAAMFGHGNAAGQLLKMYNEENGRQKLISFGIAILFGRKGVVTLLAVINKKYIESALKFAQGL
jgi:ankyrin repeat protein